jgi:carbon-monoxide dehydrogenase small subunit
MIDISLTVNGEPVDEQVEARTTLVDFLREDLVLTGSHVGCEHGVCGACTVRVNGAIVRGCLMLAAQCDGAVVETIEGLSDSGEVADLQAAFEQRNALQCGFCTPGMIATAQELLTRAKDLNMIPTRDEIREHISGNYCRCTGYHAIVDAVEAVANDRLSTSLRDAGAARGMTGDETP